MKLPESQWALVSLQAFFRGLLFPYRAQSRVPHTIQYKMQAHLIGPLDHNVQKGLSQGVSYFCHRPI
jgi:hypothetical protein